MAKQPKREDLLAYPCWALYENWPKIVKRFGLREDTFSKPDIELTKKSSEYQDGGVLKINYATALRAYYGKSFSTQGLEIKYHDLVKDDVIHECVHYIQGEFYGIGEDRYDYVTEGLAALVTIEVHLENKDYDIAVIAITDFFIQAKKEYKDYFNLPKKYNKHIKKIIEEGVYKPEKDYSMYTKGFFHICEEYRQGDGNYLKLLLEPFENPEAC